RGELVGRVYVVVDDPSRANDPAAAVAAGTRMLEGRTRHPELAADAELSDDSRLWAALQEASGGTWGGCVYDVERITRLLAAGRHALGETPD
ncbi:MAG: hypothetical protein KDA63_03870, partial [Planctomycetales bacterium]|nr:hypothetical protein [Planctomycetales bacterium]